MRGTNSHCKRFCSARDSFLRRDLSGERLWANFPFRRMEEFLSHYFEQKERHPELTACLVVPVWKTKRWWSSVADLPVVAHFPAGTELFTAPAADGTRVSLGPTRWPVEIRLDPPSTCAVSSRDHAPSNLPEPEEPEIGVTHGGVAPQFADSIQPRATADARQEAKSLDPSLWRISVVGTVGDGEQLPTQEETAPVGAVRASAIGELPRLLYVPGHLNSRPMTAFLDSGAQLNLISTEFVEKHGFQMDSPTHGVCFPDGRKATLKGIVRNACLKMGSYKTHLDLHVFDLKGQFDVLLGKGWHEDEQPQINWRMNQVQVWKEDTAHRFGTRNRPCPPKEEKSAAVSVLAAAPFAKACKKGGETFIAVVRALQEPAMAAAVAQELPPGLGAMDDDRTSGQRPYAEVLEQYASVFAPLPPGIPPNRGVEHHIDLTPGARPKAKPPYRLSQLEEEECIRQIQLYLKMGHIRPSKSPFGAPVLFVRKKNGQLRLCIDYRALNDDTIRDRFPLPRIDDMLDQLHGATVFSKLDLSQGYHQVRVAPEDVHKTAFTTKQGHFEFQVMPFGLCNAPATFQRLMNTVLQPHLRKFCTVYLDDVLIYSKDPEEHAHHLKMVLETLQEAGLFAQLSKCEFGLRELQFLGHIVSADGIKMDPEKISAMTAWPVPKENYWGNSCHPVHMINQREGAIAYGPDEYIPVILNCPCKAGSLTKLVIA